MPSPTRAPAKPKPEPAPIVQRNRERTPIEPLRSFTMRVSVASANRFIEWCDQERISYREAFDVMVGKLENHN